MSTAEIITLPALMLDKCIPVTVFPDAFAQSLKVVEIPIRELPRAMTKRTAASKKRLPLLKLATFGDQRSPANCLRTNANMLEIYGVEGDYDRGEVGIDEAVARLRRAGLAAIVYTSPSHKPDKPRWRVLCFTSAPMPPGERTGLVARLNGALGGILGDESFVQSQSFYYGRLQGHASYRVELLDGRAIDLADDLDAEALGKQGKPFLPFDPEELGAAPPDWPRHKPRIVAALEAIPEDERSDYGLWFDCIAALHYESGGSLEGREIGREWSEPAPNFDEKKSFDYHWASLRRKGGQVKGKATIFWHAKRLSGFDPKSVKQTGELVFIDYDDAKPRLDVADLVEGLLMTTALALIWGNPGAGKTWFALHLALSIAAGRKFFGRRVRQVRVVYVAAEAGRSIEDRMVAARDVFGTGLPLTAMVTPIDLCHGNADLTRLIEAIRARAPVGLVVIDTLARVLGGGNENGPEDMGALVMNVDRLRDALGCAVLVVHHSGKDQSRGARGHSLLHAAVDTELELTREDKITTARVTKQRDFASEGAFSFSLRPVELGVNSGGRLVTSCVIEEASRPAKEDDLPAGAKVVLGIWGELKGRYGKVTVSMLRQAAIKSRELSGSDNDETHQKAYDRARLALVKKKRLVVRDGLVVLYEEDSGFDVLGTDTDRTGT